MIHQLTNARGTPYSSTRPLAYEFRLSLVPHKVSQPFCFNRPYPPKRRMKQAIQKGEDLSEFKLMDEDIAVCSYIKYGQVS